MVSDAPDRALVYSGPGVDALPQYPAIMRVRIICKIMEVVLCSWRERWQDNQMKIFLLFA